MLTMIKAYMRVNRSVLSWLSVLFFMMFGIAFILEQAYILPGFYFIWVVAATFLQTEEKFKTDPLYCSLPVKREQIVLARYGAVLLAFLLVTVFSLATILVIKLSNFEGVTLPVPLITIETIIAPLLPVSFFFSFGLPFYFLWGYNRGMIFGTVLMAVLTGLGSWLMDLIVKSLAEPETWQALVGKVKLARPFNLLLGGIVRAYSYFGERSFVIGFGLVTAVLVFFSYRYSLKLFLKKDIH